MEHLDLLFEFKNQTISTWNDNVAFTDDEEMKMLLYSCGIAAYTILEVANLSEKRCVDLIEEKYYKRFPPLEKTTLQKTFDFVNMEMKKFWHDITTSQKYSTENLKEEYKEESVINFLLVIVAASYMLGYTLSGLFEEANNYKPTKATGKILTQKRLLIKKSQEEAKKVQNKANSLRKKNYTKIDEEFKKDIWNIDHERIAGSIKNRCLRLIRRLQSGEISNTSAGKDLIVYADYLMKLIGWTYDDVKDLYLEARKEFE